MHSKKNREKKRIVLIFQTGLFHQQTFKSVFLENIASSFHTSCIGPSFVVKSMASPHQAKIRHDQVSLKSVTRHFTEQKKEVKQLSNYSYRGKWRWPQTNKMLKIEKALFFTCPLRCSCNAAQPCRTEKERRSGHFKKYIS